jgi:hypothetical protein
MIHFRSKSVEVLSACCTVINNQQALLDADSTYVRRSKSAERGGTAENMAPVLCKDSGTVSNVIRNSHSATTLPCSC